MFKLLLFLKRIHYVLLFVALEAIAVSAFLRSNTYHRSKAIALSNVLLSGVYGKTADIGQYFGLRAENQRLLAENVRLRNELARSRYAFYGNDVVYRDGDQDMQEGVQLYEYLSARVVNNRVSRRENYLTIDRGVLDGVRPEMAIVNDEGIVGYVMRCSDHFSIAVSVLNTRSFRTSGRLKGSRYDGPLYWDGADYREVILDEIPKYADLKIGDTITTTDYSYIFPPDQPIGTVASFELWNGTFYKIRVRLLADMARLGNVYVVKYLEQQERRELETSIGNEELPDGGIIQATPVPEPVATPVPEPVATPVPELVPEPEIPTDSISL